VNHVTYIIVSVFTAMLFIACSGGDAFKGGTAERKPPRLTAGAAAVDSAAESSKPILAVDYDVSVDTDKPMNLCKGTANVVLGSDLKFKPTGKIKCILVGEKDLSELFKDEGAEEAFDPSKFAEAGKITRKANTSAGARFTPPRPNLIGPLIQDVEVYKNYRFVEESVVEVNDPQSGPISDKGAFFIKVLEAGVPFTAPVGGQKYDNVIHWEISTSGFVNAGKIGVFEKTEYWQNARPIAIPQIKMYTKLSQLFAGGMSAIGDAFLGKVIITISVKNETRF
jgi:hypothetical protein